jgi:hypothetical protein
MGREKTERLLTGAFGVVVSARGAVVSLTFCESVDAEPAPSV